MNTRLTVSDCQNAFGSLFPSSDFLPYLNQGVERLMQSGKWKGLIERVIFDNSAGYITLPYEYGSILGSAFDQYPVPNFSQFYPYISSGPGVLDQSKPFPGVLIDLGDGYPTLLDPPTAGSTLRIVLDNAVDVGKTFRFYGISNGLEIFDVNGRGMNITTTGITTNETTVFDRVTGIECPLTATGAPSMVFPWTLQAVSPTGTVTTLSRYYPPDIRPTYRRYQTGTWDKAIQCLCQLRFIPAYATTDWVIPGSLGAIKAAMQAVQCEDANNYEQAAPLWIKAQQLLDNEVHSYRGNARPVVDMELFGWGQNFPWIT